MSKKEPKILVWDIETSHMKTATFSLYPNFISHSNILQDWFLFCGAYKWLGSKKVSVVKLTKEELKNNDDSRIVKLLCDVINEADLIVAHNGDKFDTKKLKARAIANGLPPVSFVRSIDTLKVARREFKFTSNRLDYLGKHLLGEGKLHTSPGLWLQVLDGSVKALNEMAAYNKIDVVVLEKLYLKLRPWMQNHPNIANLLGKDREACKACGSTDTMKHGFRHTQAGKYQKYQCKKCAHIFTETKRMKS